MRSLLLALILMVALLFMGCPGSTSANGPKIQTVRVGWVGDHFFPSSSAIQDSGSSPQLLKTVPGYLVMQDMRWIQGQEAYRFFIQKIGSTKWDTIPNPVGVQSFGVGWTVDSSFVYAGSINTPHLFQLDATTKTWTEIPISLADSVKTKRGIFSQVPHSPDGVPYVLRYNDSMLIQISDVASDGYLYPELDLWGTSQGGLWNGTPDSMSENDAWLASRVYHGSLYVATYGHGVWRMGANRLWSQTAKTNVQQMPGGITGVMVYETGPRAIEVVNDKMYVSFLGGHVYRYNDAVDTWTDVAACDSGTVCFPKPNNNMALTQYKGRLIAAGMDVPVPVWYNDTTGVWTWLSYETWRNAFPTSDHTGPTYDMTVVGDTLYVAHEKGIVKLDLTDPAVWTADTTDAKTVQVKE